MSVVIKSANGVVSVPPTVPQLAAVNAVQANGSVLNPVNGLVDLGAVQIDAGILDSTVTVSPVNLTSLTSYRVLRYTWGSGGGTTAQLVWPVGTGQSYERTVQFLNTSGATVTLSTAGNIPAASQTSYTVANNSGVMFVTRPTGLSGIGWTVTALPF